MLQKVTKSVRIEPILQLSSDWRRKINRWKSISGSTSWYHQKRVLVAWTEGIFRCTDFWYECLRPQKQNTQNRLQNEWTWEKKRLQLQHFECQTRTIYSTCFLDTGGMGKECSVFVKQLCQMISIKQKELCEVATKQFIVRMREPWYVQ